MSFILMLAATFSFSTSLLANNHDLHDESYVILEGLDRAANKPCHLYVLDILESAEGEVSLLVATSYSHGTEKPQPILLSDIREKALYGVGSNGKDQLALFFSGATDSLNFKEATHFNLRWWHGHHYHNFSCANLKVHEHEHEHDHN